jgi:hypothetical protein
VIGDPSIFKEIRKTVDLAGVSDFYFQGDLERGCDGSGIVHGHVVTDSGRIVFHNYESIEREVKRRLIFEYRCDERLKTKTEEFTRLTTGRGKGNA